MVYPKFKSKEECAYPDRQDCNGDTPDCKTRCEYMKYNNSKSIFDPTRWECKFNKLAQFNKTTPINEKIRMEKGE